MTAPCQIGDRVRLTAPMPDEYPPPGLPAGLEGTVTWVGGWDHELTRQLGVKWDNGRTLNLLGGDSFEVLPRPWVDPTGFPCELDGLS